MSTPSPPSAAGEDAQVSAAETEEAGPAADEVLAEALKTARGWQIAHSPPGSTWWQRRSAISKTSPYERCGVLRSVDRIACEDTRQTAKLLGHYGIRKPTVSYHLHNEVGRAAELVEALRAGGRVAVVSDAGMPGIADPGATLVQAAVAAGVTVYPVPGANAALSALVASGLDTERFLFHGFLPSKAGQRRSVLERVRSSAMLSEADEAGTHLFYESPPPHPGKPGRFCDGVRGRTAVGPGA